MAKARPNEQVSVTLAEWDALYLDEPFHCGPFSVHHQGAWYSVWVVHGRCGHMYQQQTMEQVCAGFRCRDPQRLRGYYERPIEQVP